MSRALPQPPGSSEAPLVLLTRAECGLCEQMRSALQRLAGSLPLPPLRELDVDADGELQRRYGLKVPVLLLDGAPVCRTHWDEAALREALLRRARPRAGFAPAPQD